MLTPAVHPEPKLGQPLTLGQLRQLQWIVPHPWSLDLAWALAELPIAGAGVRVRVEEFEHWIGFFDGDRMVDEALRPEAAPLIASRALLPIAGCGRRGTSVFLVDVATPGAPLWLRREGEPGALPVGLLDLWNSSMTEPRVRLRRRLPEKSPRRLAKTRPRSPRLAAGGEVCQRTLPLFG